MSVHVQFFIYKYESMLCTLSAELWHAVIHAGPLEATAANLAREVAAKQADGRALQRRWAARQAELVVLAQVHERPPAPGHLLPLMSFLLCCVAMWHAVRRAWVAQTHGTA